MLRVMIQKMWHKKWMVLCLLLGNLLLIATVVSFPMYRGAAFDRLLVDEFDNYLAKNGTWPGLNEMKMISKNDRSGKSIQTMENYLHDLGKRFGVQTKEAIIHYCLSNSEVISEMNRKDVEGVSVRLGFLSGLPEHAKMISGEMYSEDGLTENGDAIEVVISQSCMVDNNLLVGETLEYKSLKTTDGKKIRMKIVGVFEQEDRNDFYWQVKPEDLSIVCLMNEQLFRDYFTGEHAGKYTISCYYYHLFDYPALKEEQVENLLEQTIWLTKESPIRSTVEKPVYLDLLDQFEKKKDRIEATLFILQVPVLILLCAFLFMISSQMYDMERNEISVMKSRGGSSLQMFLLYLYQSIFLAFTGALFGIPLGTVFCRVLGSTQNFLEFRARRELSVEFSVDVWKYSLISVAVCVLIMTLPALKHSRLTIVKLKQSNALKKKPLWEKLFLDIICLAVALYGYYSFSRNEAVMVQDVLQGQALDPLLYLSSSLFIVGMGLLFLRLQPLLVKLVYLAGKNFWKPASYASFMENLKNGRKQQFIMLFMILTISLGMFHAIVARTILQNARENAEYLENADIVIREIWNSNATSASANQGNFEFRYIEPDYTKYASIPGVQSFTKVIYDEKAMVELPGRVFSQGTLMAIHTREFGEITSLSDDLLEKPYYEYLNELAVEPKGLLVSRNFETTYGYQIGSTMEYKDGKGNKTTGKIVDFFDYWPGYAPTSASIKADGTAEIVENLLIIANIATVQQNFGVTPYEVWVDVKEGTSREEIYQWVEKQKLRASKFNDKKSQLEQVIEDPLLQGTNGVLTMGFIVTIILCGVGYLIYWIMSIRSREMIFGILRACGMHKGELFQMLINEQIFSGVLSIFAGIGIGTLSSRMFVPILQTAYTAANQVLPMKLITNPVDMIRLYTVVTVVMMICLLTLILLVFRLNVTKALKLGEE